MCRGITFEKIASHTKYEEPNVQSHLHFSLLNFDKVNHRFLHPFLLLGKTESRKNVLWGNQ